MIAEHLLSPLNLPPLFNISRRNNYETWV